MRLSIEKGMRVSYDAHDGDDGEPTTREGTVVDIILHPTGVCYHLLVHVRFDDGFLSDGIVYVPYSDVRLDEKVRKEYNENDR